MDARSLAHQFAEIFVDRGYEVTGLGTTPRIIDCGGNIGLSSIWFRLQYPRAVITVFEADPNIANILAWNLRSCGAHDVEVVHAAVGAYSGAANFLPDNSDGGHVGEGNGITVPSVRLADRLYEPVDILKIDIEGGEFALIGDLCDSGRISLVKHLICEVHGHKLVQEQLGEVWSALTHQGFCLAIGWALTVPTAVPGGDPTPFPGLKSARYHLHLYGWKPSL